MNVMDLRSKRGFNDAADDGLGKVVRRSRPERLIHIRKMLAIELIELAIVGRVMLRAVPPVPVAAFGNEQLFERQLPLLLRTIRCCLFVEVARVVEVVPRLVVFGSTDPDVEVGMNPRAGSNGIQYIHVTMALDRLRNGQRFDLWIFLQAIVKPPEKLAAGFGIVFPGVFSVENDRKNHVLTA